MDARLFTPLALACQVFVCLPAMAQNALTVPMEVMRVSNPTLTAESRGNVTLYRVHPQYTLQSIDGSSRTELSLGAMVEKSSNTDLSANRTLPSIRGLWENATAISVFRLQGSLEEASTRETEFAEFGRVTSDSTQRTGTFGGSWVQDLSEGSSVELVASHARVSYDAPSVIDFSETLGSVAYRSELSAISRYSLTASASRLNPSSGAESASRGEVGLGYEIDLREDVTLNAAGGVVRSNSTRGKTDPVGSLRIAYTGERLGYALAWARSVSAGGTLGGYTRSDNFDASFDYPFTVNTSMSLGFAYAKSREDGGDAGSTVYARIRSELSRFWALTLGLEQRRATPFGGPTGRGNSFGVGLVYAHPDF